MLLHQRPDLYPEPHQFNPDRFPEGENRTNHDRIVAINVAYEVLGDLKRRQDYDCHRFVRTSGAQSSHRDPHRSADRYPHSDREQRTATAQAEHRRRQSAVTEDDRIREWLEEVYLPIDRAVEIDPELVVARYFRARHRWERSDLSGALDDLQYAVERDPVRARIAERHVSELEAGGEWTRRGNRVRGRHDPGPLLVLGVPIVDVLFAIVRRTVSGTGFATADTGHLHHRLIRLGHGPRRAVVILWAWTALLSGFALVPALNGGSSPLWAFGLAAVALLGFTLFHDRLRPSLARVHE
mgnify:CR=1 FL=1